MFCGCRGEKVSIDQARYSVIERIAEGYVTSEILVVCFNFT